MNGILIFQARDNSRSMSLLTGVLWVSIQGEPGAKTPDQLARVRDAIATVNGTVDPYGVRLVAVDAESGTFADIRIQISSTSTRMRIRWRRPCRRTAGSMASPVERVASVG